MKKLVRDRIPEIMLEQGKQPEIFIADEKFFVQALNDKLQEEVTEFLNHPSVEELCDILEVIMTISQNMGCSMQELEIKRINKFKERGGFEKKYILNYEI